MRLCPNCGLKFAEERLPETCPSCGLRQSVVSAEASPLGLIQNYFSDVWRIMTGPGKFFRGLSLQGGLGGPLAFALVTHWIGSALSYLWQLLFGGNMMGFFSRFFRLAGSLSDIESTGRRLPWEQLLSVRERISHWFWGLGTIAIDPFYTLASVLFTAALVYLGARILVTPGKDGAPREITFESAVRLICYGMSPAILTGIPFFGWGVASILTLIVTVIGAMEIYKVKTVRAVLIALFPKLIFLGLILTGIFVFAVAFIKFLTSFM